jgi:hypothetical protein
VEKINLESVKFFSGRKTTTQRTTKDHQLTTNSPQKTIQKRTIFQNPPRKSQQIRKKIRPAQSKLFVKNQGFF